MGRGKKNRKVYRLIPDTSVSVELEESSQKLKICPKRELFVSCLGRTFFSLIFAVSLPFLLQLCNEFQKVRSALVLAYLVSSVFLAPLLVVVVFGLHSTLRLFFSLNVSDLSFLFSRFLRFEANQ